MFRLLLGYVIVSSVSAQLPCNSIKQECTSIPRNLYQDYSSDDIYGIEYACECKSSWWKILLWIILFCFLCCGGWKACKKACLEENNAPGQPQVVVVQSDQGASASSTQDASADALEAAVLRRLAEQQATVPTVPTAVPTAVPAVPVFVAGASNPMGSVTVTTEGTIGAMMKDAPTTGVILSAIDAGGTAELAGAKMGMYIISLNDTNTSMMSKAELISFAKGLKGSKVWQFAAEGSPAFVEARTNAVDDKI